MHLTRAENDAVRRAVPHPPVLPVEPPLALEARLGYARVQQARATEAILLTHGPLEEPSPGRRAGTRVEHSHPVAPTAALAAAAAARSSRLGVVVVVVALEERGRRRRRRRRRSLRAQQLQCRLEPRGAHDEEGGLGKAEGGGVAQPPPRHHRHRRGMGWVRRALGPTRYPSSRIRRRIRIRIRRRGDCASSSSSSSILVVVAAAAAVIVIREGSAEVEAVLVMDRIHDGTIQIVLDDHDVPHRIDVRAAFGDVDRLPRDVDEMMAAVRQVGVGVPRAEGGGGGGGGGGVGGFRRRHGGGGRGRHGFARYLFHTLSPISLSL